MNDPFRPQAITPLEQDEPPPCSSDPPLPFGRCPVRSCGQAARALDADSQGQKVRCARCGRTEALPRYVARRAVTREGLLLAAGGLGLGAIGAWLPFPALLPAAAVALAVAGWLWALRAAVVAWQLRDRHRWATAWEPDARLLLGWGARQSTLWGLVRDVSTGRAGPLEEAVWRAQRVAEEAAFRIWIAPEDPESGRYLAWADELGPAVDRTVRSFLARAPGDAGATDEVRALLAAFGTVGAAHPRSLREYRAPSPR